MSEGTGSVCNTSIILFPQTILQILENLETTNHLNDKH